MGNFLQCMPFLVLLINNSSLVTSSSYDDCQFSPELTPSYSHKSFTPHLLLKNGSQPCGIMKLNCLPTSNFDFMERVARNTRERDLDIRPTLAWTELLTFSLATLVSKTGVNIPRTRGVLVNGSHTPIYDVVEGKIPHYCFHGPYGVLLGVYSTFISGLRKLSITSKTLESLDAKNVNSLAFLWLIDALP